MAREDEVSTEHVVAIDGETKPGHDLDHPVENFRAGYRVVKLGVAVIIGVSRGKNSDDHGDGSVAVEEANNDTNTTD